MTIVTKKDGTVSHRPMIVAAAVAMAMLVVTGIGYRQAAARYARYANKAPLLRGSLRALDYQLGPWTGRDIPVDSALINMLNVDECIQREYWRDPYDPPVVLAIAYSARPRDLLPHRPEICYPSAGWTLQSDDSIEVQPVDEVPLACVFHTFGRGGLSDREARVLSYYLVDGRYVPDVAGVRDAVLRSAGDAPYVLLVQFISETDAGDPAAEAHLRALAADSAPAIRDMLKQAVRKAREREAAGIEEMARNE